MRSKYFVLVLFVIFTFLTAFTRLSTKALVPAQLPEQQDSPSEATANIVIDVNGTTTPVNPHVLGTNVPAWLGSWRTENGTFLARTNAANLTVIRIPGGSWSNWYDWSNCELNNKCPWEWGVLSPTDFINLLQATGAEGMFTINQNGTSKEAAAAVAFFNGAVNDTTVIGTDVRGKDWKTVGYWAQLRSSHGNSDPINIKYWEIGNETYGGSQGSGKDCVDWGWEEVWTCDGTEYVNGIGSDTDRKEGFIEFRNAMRAVDPTIMVGAVGVAPQADWSNWGNEVIAAAGNQMDFYLIHQYAYFSPPATRQEALTQPQSTWKPIMDDVNASFDQYAGGRRVPIAVTEHNLFSVQDMDNGQWMTQAVNMLFMADSIGQMMKNGFAIANQWDLANGQAGNGTDYGLLNADTYARSPQYYVFPLWSKFGTNMIPLTSPYNAATTLSVYAGKLDPWTASVLVINKTGSPISTNLEFTGAPALLLNGKADVVQAASLDSTTVTYNGVSNPSNDLSNAPSTSLSVLTNPMPYTFPAYSVTLLQIGLEEFVPTDWVYLPAVLR